MITEDGILNIDSTMDNDQLVSLSKEIGIHLSEIREVQIDMKMPPASSALFSLLVSLKKANNNISIPIIDNTNNISSLGMVSFVKARG